MIRVVPFESWHVRLLQAQGIQEAQVVSFVPAAYAIVDKLSGPRVTAFSGDNVILCGGLVTFGPKLGLLWAVLSGNAGAHMLRIHRGVLRFLDIEPIRRIEATCEEGFDQGKRWLELLGFTYEGKMPCYGERGETHLRFGRYRAVP